MSSALRVRIRRLDHHGLDSEGRPSRLGSRARLRPTHGCRRPRLRRHARSGRKLGRLLPPSHVPLAACPLWDAGTPSRAPRRLLPCRPNPKRVRPGLGTSAFVLVPLGPGYRIGDISHPKHRRAQRSRRPWRAATASSGDRVAQAVRDRSPSSAQLAPLHGSFWWPSRSAVDDPPAMRNQSRARSRLRLRRLEPGNSGRVPWQVHSCPSLSVPRATGGPASPFWSRSSSATRRRPRGAGTRRRRSGVCVSPGGRWSPRRSADRIGSPPAGFWIRF